MSSNEIAIILFNIQNQVKFFSGHIHSTKPFISKNRHQFFLCQKKSEIFNVKFCCYFLLYIKEYQYKTLFKFLLLVLEFIERRRRLLMNLKSCWLVWRSVEVLFGSVPWEVRYWTSSGGVSTGFDSLVSCYGGSFRVILGFIRRSFGDFCSIKIS